METELKPVWTALLLLALKPQAKYESLPANVKYLTRNKTFYSFTNFLSLQTLLSFFSAFRLLETSQLVKRKLTF